MTENKIFTRLILAHKVMVGDLILIEHLDEMRALEVRSVQKRYEAIHHILGTDATDRLTQGAELQTLVTGDYVTLILPESHNEFYTSYRIRDEGRSASRKATARHLDDIFNRAGAPRTVRKSRPGPFPD